MDIVKAISILVNDPLWDGLLRVFIINGLILIMGIIVVGRSE